MKIILSSLALIMGMASLAQDTLPPPITNRETSFDNYELLVIALIGLALLLALYFMWRRRRR